VRSQHKGNITLALQIMQTVQVNHLANILVDVELTTPFNGQRSKTTPLSFDLTHTVAHQLISLMEHMQGRWEDVSEKLKIGIGERCLTLVTFFKRTPTLRGCLSESFGSS
jgi:hypothetical protein